MATCVIFTTGKTKESHCNYDTFDFTFICDFTTSSSFLVTFAAASIDNLVHEVRYDADVHTYTLFVCCTYVQQ